MVYEKRKMASRYRKAFEEKLYMRAYDHHLARMHMTLFLDTAWNFIDVSSAAINMRQFEIQTVFRNGTKS
jgi:hypothetical protein